MARSKRKLPAKNKIDGSFEGELIKAEPEPFPDAPAQFDRTLVRKITRSSFFNAEFEALIELIAIDRVYRAMLERRGRRLLTVTIAPPIDPMSRGD